MRKGNGTLQVGSEDFEKQKGHHGERKKEGEDICQTYYPNLSNSTLTVGLSLSYNGWEVPYILVIAVWKAIKLVKKANYRENMV